MKKVFEQIEPINENSSFFWLINPKLNDFYFWHFHPEIELVYIEADEGTRHVGQHISKYKKADLVLIGSYIPHLNFDYGIKTDYKQTVLQFKPSFLEASLLIQPELKLISELFDKIKFGISFGEITQQKIKEKFVNAHLLNTFDQFVSVLEILQILSEAKDYELLHKTEPTNNTNRKEQQRLKAIYDFIDLNYNRKIDLDEIAAITNLTKAAFCRYFKKITRLTFTEFLNFYRVNEAKRLLLLDKNITETCFMVGFDSLSYFNRIFKKITGENPKTYKSKFVSK